jgi:hypothetical protein
MIAQNYTQPREKELRGTDLRDLVRKEYLSGQSVWALQNRFARLLSCTEVKNMVADILRPKGGLPKSDPTESEIVVARDAIKSRWTDEVASRRWVGRYLSSPESRGEALSKTFRSWGGDC